MATLEPTSYRLRHGHETSLKRVIFVKLTDSALTAFENLQKTKDRNQASINIGEKDGCIQLPSGESFSFAVSNIPADVPKGSFECIQKTRKGEVEHVGDIIQRITIHATEDSFSATKQKMTLADEESKKQCAKPIESSKTALNLANRMRGKRNSPEPTFGISSNKKPRLDSSPLNTPFSGSTAAKKKPTSQMAIKPATAYPSKPPLPSSSGTLASRTSQPSSSSLPGSSGTPPNNSLFSHSPVPPARSPVSQPPSRPLRERVIHALAPKSIGKTDFIQKMQKYGLKEDERPLLEGLLAEVSSMKDGRFDILPSILTGEVDPKWAMYNPADTLAVQKRLSSLENKRPSTSSQPSSVIDKSVKSSSVGTGSSSAGSSGQKGNLDVARTFVARPSEEAISPPPSSSSTCSTPSPPDHSKLKEISNRNVLSTKKPDLALGARDELFGSQEDNVNATGDKLSAQESLEKLYGVIKSSDQRRQYKKDFYSVYNEYKDLHEDMAKVSSRFGDLEEKLRKARKGTPEYKRICQDIQKDYLLYKSDENYKKKRQRWEYLTSKLTIIKQHIKNYDSTNLKT